ncbi:MAG TPA: hypothetical protein VFS11_01095 [Gemmatimonadales bacterium]|nr:hypothetical protein [Gemmatimonadales bacterium]
MARRPPDLYFAAGLTAAYFCLAAVVVAHHEMWGDELQTWLLVRNSGSLPELFHHLAYEGHPALWHLLLYALQHTVSTAPPAMQWLHLGIATATVAIVAAVAPFTRLQRALFAFGYYAFYEYAVIARNYGIGLLLTVIACALVARRRPAPLATGVVLFLLAHTNVFGTITAAALVAGLAAEWLIERRRHRPVGVDAKRAMPSAGALAWMVGLGVLGVVTAAWQMKPPPDYGFAIGWHLRPNADLLRLTLRIPAFTFLPLHPVAHDFWGRTVVGEHVWLKRVTIVLSLALLAWTARVAARRPVALAWYVLTVLGCLAFYYAKYLGTLRHYGMLVAAVVVAYWLAFAGAEPSTSRRTPELRWASLVLTAVLALQALAGVATGWLDWRYVFSSAQQAAAAVGRANLSGCVLAGIGTPTDVGIAAVLGYLPGQRRAYYVRTERFESFVIWDIRSRRRVTDSAVVARSKRLAAETHNGVLLLVPRALPAMPDAPRFFAAFTGSAVPEDFFLYIVRPPDEATERGKGEAVGDAAARCHVPS